jgi:hypothetical protein
MQQQNSMSQALLSSFATNAFPVVAGFFLALLLLWAAYGLAILAFTTPAP